MLPDLPIKVSVVLCTYNGADFIEEQLNSILHQTYPLHEIVIVDDCSTDGTVETIEKFVGTSSMVKIIKNELNLGYNKNYEKALLLSTGDVIAISDQDDVWNVKKIETLLSKWKEDSLLIYSESVVFKNQIPQNPKPTRIVHRVQGNNPRHLAIYNTISGHAMMIKRELLNLSVPFEKDVFYDWWLAFVASCNGGISYTPDILVYQRAHDKNVTIPKDASCAQTVSGYKEKLVPQLKKFLSAPNLPQEDQNFYQKFLSLWNESLTKKNNWRLFFFLMAERKDIFYFKRRPIEFISHFKHSILFSFKKH